MTVQEPKPRDVIAARNRFGERHKLLANREEISKASERIRALLAAGDKDTLRAFLKEQYPPDIADIMYFLDDSQDLAVFELLDVTEAAEVLDETDRCTRELIARTIALERLAQLVDQLPADEATDILQAAGPDKTEAALKLADPETVQGVRRLLPFAPQSAGGIMSTGYVAVRDSTTAGEALRRYAEQEDAEPFIHIYVVDDKGSLHGAVDLHWLLAADPATPVREYTFDNHLFVYPDLDQENVARIFARYDLTALPVVERESGRLLGVITADDIIDVLEEEATEDTLRMAGSDAEELEKRTPARIAFMRLPWIMATMFIELLAGFVIHIFDATLAHVILLASFMPIISAISGNTGLQSATIIVRGLSTGQIRVLDWQHAVLRQLQTTLILGAATGLTLGVIGSLWYGKWTFGIVVTVGMFMAVNIAGVVGTVVPLTSKRLGYDPAITSGPFETAFQDVVGISIFLGLATLLIHYLL